MTREIKQRTAEEWQKVMGWETLPSPETVERLNWLNGGSRPDFLPLGGRFINTPLAEQRALSRARRALEALGLEGYTVTLESPSGNKSSMTF